MSLFTRIGRYVPLVVGLVILLIIAVLAPWEAIDDLLEEIPLSIFLILLGFSMFYYISKVIRYWYILYLLDIHLPFKPVLLIYLSGQPFSLLPAGELYRTVLLKRHLGVSATKSSPAVTIQGLVEAIVLMLISLAGAFLIGRNQVAVILVGIALLAIIVTLQQGWFIKTYSLINKIPGVSFDEKKFQRFIRSHQEILAPKSLAILVAFSLLPVLAGTGILYIASHAVGFSIGYEHSAIAYSLPVVVSGLSFIPGGFGVSEGGTIGMLQLFGASIAAAMTIALLVRIFTLFSGLVYGVLAQLVIHFKKGV